MNTPELKLRRLMPFLIAFASLLAGCSTMEQQDAQLRAALDELQGRFAPDRRVAVFDVTWERSGAGLVAKGEVDQAEARLQALKVLGEVSGLNVLDSLRVLPDPDLQDRHFGVVTVSVGNMRGRPGHSSELVSQVLMGMVVKLMKRRGGWYYVQSYDQYLGWMEGGSLEIVSEAELENWREAKKLITTAAFGIVTQKPALNARPVSDIVVGCTFKAVRDGGRWMKIELPDGRAGYVERSLVQNFDEWKRNRRLSPESIGGSALAFMGVPYLWGGTSAKGFDCSGFTKTVYRMNGLELDRDANQQALQGDDIPGGTEWMNLRKGDLLFFGNKAAGSTPERITHVGIYLSNGEYVHCSSRVRLNNLDPSAPNYDDFNLKRFVRARRVLGATGVPEIL
jgi:hypothetical protein